MIINICSFCNGSGEGQHEGEKCQACYEKGVINTGKSKEILADIYAEYQADAMRDEPKFY